MLAFFFTVTVLLNFFHFFPTFFLYIFAIMNVPKKTVGFPFSTQSYSQISTFTLLFSFVALNDINKIHRKDSDFPAVFSLFSNFWY